MPNKQETDYQQAREHFIAQWGALGSAWGINRTMAQIHALLMVAHKPLSTQDVMDELDISRGNANTNLRELVSWGLLRSHVIKGDRKEYFEAEKEVWKIFCIVSRERRRREIAPALQVLRECQESGAKASGEEQEAFYGQLAHLAEFIELADSIMEKVAAREQSRILPKVLKVL